MVGGQISGPHFVLRMTQLEGIILLLGGEERLHALHLKLHLDLSGELGNHFLHGVTDFLFGVHGGTYCGKEMGVIRVHDMLFIQF